MSRRRMGGWAVLVAVVLVGLWVGGTADAGPRTAEDRIHDLASTTLCPVCDGQNVLESNAPVADAIRSQIRVRVQAGDTDAQIRSNLANRFGDDVVAIPPSGGLGGLVWAIPVVVVALGAGVVGFMIWRGGPADAAVSAEARATVEAARRGSST